MRDNIDTSRLAQHVVTIANHGTSDTLMCKVGINSSPGIHEILAHGSGLEHGMYTMTCTRWQTISAPASSYSRTSTSSGRTATRHSTL